MVEMIWSGKETILQHTCISDNGVLSTFDSRLGEVHKEMVIAELGRITTVPHRALISTPPNTFGMSWNADSVPDIIPQHQCPNDLMAEWKQIHFMYTCMTLVLLLLIPDLEEVLAGEN